MQQDTFTRLTAFLHSLKRGKIHYTLQNCRDEAIMVLVTVPGERWEVEFLVDGSVEVERFIRMVRYTVKIHWASCLCSILTKKTKV